MVVVRHWSEVLDAGARQRWWSQHAPRLEALTAAGGLRVEGYWKYLFRGLDSGAPPSVVFLIIAQYSILVDVFLERPKRRSKLKKRAHTQKHASTRTLPQTPKRIL